MCGSSELLFGATAGGFLVRIEGRGTMHQSPAVEQFIEQGLQSDAEAIAVLDLSGCTYLDSTFLGCLVALHKRHSLSPPRFLVVAPPEVRRRLLAPTGLDSLLEVAETPPDVEGEWRRVPGGEVRQPEFVRHLIDCHRRLAELGGPQAPAFRRVADQLTRELETSSR